MFFKLLLTDVCKLLLCEGLYSFCKNLKTSRGRGAIPRKISSKHFSAATSHKLPIWPFQSPYPVPFLFLLTPDSLSCWADMIVALCKGLHKVVGRFKLSSTPPGLARSTMQWSTCQYSAVPTSTLPRLECQHIVPAAMRWSECQSSARPGLPCDRGHANAMPDPDCHVTAVSIPPLSPLRIQTSETRCIAELLNFVERRQGSHTIQPSWIRIFHCRVAGLRLLARN